MRKKLKRNKNSLHRYNRSFSGGRNGLYISQKGMPGLTFQKCLAKDLWQKDVGETFQRQTCLPGTYLPEWDHSVGGTASCDGGPSTGLCV